MGSVFPIISATLYLCSPIDGDHGNDRPADHDSAAPPVGSASAEEAKEQQTGASLPEPQSGIHGVSLRLLALDSLQSLRVGPTLSLSRQAPIGLTGPGRGTNIAITPGVVFPSRILGYHDLWTHQLTPDLITDAERRVTLRDTLDGVIDTQTRRTAVQGSFIWTHTASFQLDGFAGYSTRDPDDTADAGAYRALAFGSDVWPLKRLPLRVEVGTRMLPSRPRLYFSFGYSPRHLPKPAVKAPEAPATPPTQSTSGAS